MKKITYISIFIILSFTTLYADKISTVESNIDSKFVLYQNYPNPANPTTKIKFFMGEAGNVDLAVYNLIGQKLYQLSQKPFQTGTHEVEFNASDLSSGLYIYRMEVAGKFVAVKKMTILK